MMTIWSPEEIQEFEDQFRVKCTLRPDGMYDVKGVINISGNRLHDFSIIPPIHTLSGLFNCSDNLLTSLSGCPKNIGEDFYCTHNLLTTLEGGPKSVGGDFLVSSNKLKNLIGCPSVVSGSLWCYHNNLIDLDGAPKYVGGTFECFSNPNLRFTQSQLDAMNIQDIIYDDPGQLVINDPREFIEKGVLPI